MRLLGGQQLPALPQRHLADELGLATAVTDAELDALWATDARAPHVLVAAPAPATVERVAGSVVTVGSWTARTGVPFRDHLPASKAAVEQSTRTWAAEHGLRGVRASHRTGRAVGSRVPPAGFEPATHGLGNRCSIP